MKYILFWSGGKDSYLALVNWQKTSLQKPVLLTTYEESSGIVPFQNIPIDEIEQQAHELLLDLLAIPLPSNCPNKEYIQSINQTIRSRFEGEVTLIFGDLWLKDIRKWRESVFSKLNYTCYFPIWNKPYEDLLTELWDSKVRVTITSVDDRFSDIIAPGDTFDIDFINHLPETIDKMGEKGEFHTKVAFK